jgi:hypothetical protein
VGGNSYGALAVDGGGEQARDVAGALRTNDCSLDFWVTSSIDWSWRRVAGRSSPAASLHNGHSQPSRRLVASRANESSRIAASRSRGALHRGSTSAFADSIRPAQPHDLALKFRAERAATQIRFRPPFRAALFPAYGLYARFDCAAALDGAPSRAPTVIGNSSGAPRMSRATRAASSDRCARRHNDTCPPQIFDLGWTDPAAWLSPSCGMIAA